MKVDKGVFVANIVPEKATSFESNLGNPGIQSRWDENPYKDKNLLQFQRWEPKFFEL